MNSKKEALSHPIFTVERCPVKLILCSPPFLSHDRFLLLTPKQRNLPCQDLLSCEILRHPAVHDHLLDFRAETVELQDSSEVSWRDFV